jgi:fructuronate reductase/mannitol 2-dehydrogenase
MHAPTSRGPGVTPAALNERSLLMLPTALATPTYDRSALRPAVVHIGVGDFHRAHQGVYFDELARRGVADWGVVGVGLHSGAIGDALWSQDCLYTVIESGPNTYKPRVVGAMVRFLHGRSQRKEVLTVLSDPETRLVTLTVTANAYNLDAARGFAAAAPAVARELSAVDRPDTVYGYLVEALRRRRADGVAPFTVLSCDNIPSNGAAARTMVVSFAALRDPDLAAWIDEHVTFPSSMVDRITPRTTQAVRDALGDRFGVSDRCPVITEPFRQWVIEDDFCNGRPPLDAVGAQFVEDVSAHELTKKRLLNASHCALGYLGVLAGYTTMSEVMQDRAFVAFFDGMIDEVAPLLPPADGMELGDYKAALIERFSNPTISDQLSRLCRRGSTKMPACVLPSITDAIAHRRPHPLMTLAVAGWIRFLRGVDYTGHRIELNDERGSELTPLAVRARTDLAALLADTAVFGALGDDARFVRDLQAALDALLAGPREAIERYVSAEVAAR